MDNDNYKGHDKNELIQYWLEKADESLTSAQVSYKNKAYNSAINRIYYSAFYAVKALLLYKFIKLFVNTLELEPFFIKQ